MPQEKTREEPRTEAVFAMMIGLMSAGKLTDEFLSKDEIGLIGKKPFAEWPAALQEKLRPFGAEMIG